MNTPSRGLSSLFFEGAYYSLLHSRPLYLSRLIVEGSLLERQDVLYSINGVHEHPWQFTNINIVASIP